MVFGAMRRWVFDIGSHGAVCVARMRLSASRSSDARHAVFFAIGRVRGQDVELLLFGQSWDGGGCDESRRFACGRIVYLEIGAR